MSAVDQYAARAKEEQKRLDREAARAAKKADDESSSGEGPELRAS